MTDIWLRSNRRAIALGMLLPAFVAGFGLIMMTGVGGRESAWMRIAGILMLAASGAVIGMLLIQWKQPRLAQRNGELLAYLRSEGPIHLPLEVVEAFFLGRGPGFLPGDRQQRAQTKNLVIRLAEKAGDWAEGSVKPALGCWKEGYITIRGAWCEPLSEDLVRRLNQRLHEVKQQDTLAKP